MYVIHEVFRERELDRTDDQQNDNAIEVSRAAEAIYQISNG